MKPLASFGPAIARRGHGVCRLCKNARNRDYAARNPEKVRTYALAHNNLHRAVVRKRALKSYYRHRDERLANARAAYQRPETKAAKHGQLIRRKYGISVPEYEALLVAQGGGCALCHRTPKPGRRLAVDHDHETGHVRGLLCTRCNTSIGQLGDTAPALERALAYVRRAAPPKPLAPALRINLLGAN